MSSLFSKALVYLGLVDEDQVDPETAERQPAPAVADEPRSRRAVEPLQTIQGRRVEPPSSARIATRAHGRTLDPALGGGSGGLVTPVEVHSDILVVEEFADAKILADRVRMKVPVVLDLRRAEPDLVRRVIDFSSGLIYALDGSMRKVGEGLVLVLPPRVALSRDEKRRLSSLGVYELEDDLD